MFFIHCTSANQLPGFTISGKPASNGLNNKLPEFRLNCFLMIFTSLVRLLVIVDVSQVFKHLAAEKDLSGVNDVAGLTINKLQRTSTSGIDLFLSISDFVQFLYISANYVILTSANIVLTGLNKRKCCKTMLIESCVYRSHYQI